MTKPPPLRRGDTVAAVTLSWGGAGALPHRYEAGKRQLQDTFGVRVVEMPHTLRDPEWIAGNPKARAVDLMQAFADSDIHGIVSTIGGEDSIRLIPWLDGETIASNPKVFVGYSDTTVTHLACYRAGLRTFYGPAILAGFAENCGMFEYTIDAVRRTMFSTAPVGEIEPNRSGWTDEFLDWADPGNQKRARALNESTGWRWIQKSAGDADANGVVSGHLLGGCAEVLDQLRGTPVFPQPADWQGAVLFLETSEDGAGPDYGTHLLRSLAAMGVIDRIAAVLFARPGGQIAVSRHADYDMALLGVIRGECARDDIPIISNMDFGHTDPMTVLPYGATVTIDSQRETLRIDEATCA